VGELERVEWLVAFGQLVQDSLPDVEEIWGARWLKQPEVEDPQRECVLAAPSVLGGRGVGGGRGFHRRAARPRTKFGWHELLDACPARVPVSGPLALDELDEMVPGNQVVNDRSRAILQYLTCGRYR
jgi:hypothetical protein